MRILLDIFARRAMGRWGNVSPAWRPVMRLLTWFGIVAVLCVVGATASALHLIG